MSYAQYLRQLLRPLGVYDVEGRYLSGELEAEGLALDGVESVLDELQREANLATAEDWGLERIAGLLLQETSLMEIVKLIGSDVLPDDQKLIIEIARVIRVGFLQQNFFHDQDTYVSLEKQLKMMRVILHLYEKSQVLVAKQVPMSRVLRTGLFDKLVKMKYDIPNDHLELFDDYTAEIDQKIGELMRP